MLNNIKMIDMDDHQSFTSREHRERVRLVREALEQLVAAPCVGLQVLRVLVVHRSDLSGGGVGSEERTREE